MSAKTSQPFREFLLVLACAAGLAFITCGDFQDDETLVISLAIPIAYVVGAKLLAGARLADAAGRAYLLCFFTGLLGLGVAADALLGDVSLRLQDPTQRPEDLIPQLIWLVRGLAPHFLAPMLSGICLYTACSVFDNEQQHRPNQAWTKFEQWLATSDAPSAVQQFLKSTEQQAVRLQQQFENVCSQLESTNDQVSAVQTDTNALSDSFQDLTSACRQLDGELTTLQNRLASTKSGLDQIERAVDEIDNVVNDFAQVAGSSILKS